MFVEKYFKNIKWKNTLINSNQLLNALLRSSLFPCVVIFTNNELIITKYK